MVVFILVVLIVLLCLLFGFFKSDEIERGAFGAGIVCTWGVIGLIAIGVTLWGEETIKPIDVYRGKTTLEITYRDSVAIDSVVVWK